MMSTPVPPLEVVVVTYRSEAFIRDCLRSVTQFTPAGTVLRVVDNGSQDGTVRIVRAGFPEALVLIRPDNPGFAVANNLALREVSAPYVLVLNPDASLEPGIVEHLIEVMEGSPDIGVLGCRLIKSDGTLDHAAKRFIPTPVEAAKFFLGGLLGRMPSRYTAPDIDEHGVGDVDAVNGAFMLVRTSAMREVGVFDERYWMYGEDLDWCTRFRKAGWRVVYDGRVTARHLKGASAGVRSWRLNYEFHRSMAIYWRTYGGETPLVKVLVEFAIWCKFILTATVDSVRRGVARLA